MNERFEIYSPLPPNECAKLISAAIDSERSALFSFSSLFGSQPVAGRAASSSIRLRKRITYGNSFQTYLTATMQPHGTGTLIRGEFAMHAFTRVFMPIWFGGVLLIGGSGFVISLLAMLTRPSEQHRDSWPWPFLLIPPGMLLFGYLHIRFGRYLARDEARFLTEFLRHTLHANDSSRNA